MAATLAMSRAILTRFQRLFPVVVPAPPETRALYFGFGEDDEGRAVFGHHEEILPRDQSGPPVQIGRAGTEA